MAMTLRLPPALDAALRAAGKEDHRSVHQTVILAIETFLAERETAEIKADPDALRSLAEGQEAIRAGDVIRGRDDVRKLVEARPDVQELLAARTDS